MDFQIGDSVVYKPGYMGYHMAVIVGYNNAYMTGSYEIEFSSGKRISVWEDELEAA